jgi:hypothetical protein
VKQKVCCLKISFGNRCLTHAHLMFLRGLGPFPSDSLVPFATAGLWTTETLNPQMPDALKYVCMHACTYMKQQFRWALVFLYIFIFNKPVRYRPTPFEYQIVLFTYIIHSCQP